MRQITDSHGFEGVVPDNRIVMKIKSSAKMFEILSSGIYRDKVMAVIREYICNAYDAHVEVGKAHVPFTITVPNAFEPTFSITDEGPGIDPCRIGDIYWTYGESSKTERNDQIGALGLGSKSAYAYTKSSFVVKNRYHGTEYTYFCFIDDHGEPTGSLVNEEPTEVPNGITVEFAVKPDDISAFYVRMKRFFRYWKNVRPIIKGHTNPHEFFEEPGEVVSGNDWFLENSASRNYAIAVMGNVAYPINSESIPNLPDELKRFTDNPFVITFPMGSIGFASSREDLSYDEHSAKALIARLNEVKRDFTESFRRKVFSATTHVEFYEKFREVFTQIRLTLRGCGQETIAKILFDSTLNDTVKFNNTEIIILDLVNGVFRHTTPAYQSFGFHTRQARRKTTTLRSASQLSITSISDVMINNTIFCRANATFDYDWRPHPKIPAKITTDTPPLSVVLAHPHAAETTHVIRVERRPLFVINDLGGVGIARFRALHCDEGVLVNFNPRAMSLEAVRAELDTLLVNLTGCTVKLISELPDNRAPTKIVQTPKGSMKVKVYTFSQSSIGGVLGVYVNTPLTSDHILINAVNVDETDEVVEIDGLLAQPVIYYFYKVFSRNYKNDANHVKTDFNREMISRAVTAGLIGDIKVYGLSKSQINHLQAKGAKLIDSDDALRLWKSHIDKSALATEFKQRLFIGNELFETIDDRLSDGPARVGHVIDLIARLEEEPTEFAKHLRVYRQRDSLYDPAFLIKLHMMGHELNVVDDHKERSAQFFAQYPLISALQIPNDRKDATLFVHAVLDYARMIEGVQLRKNGV